MIQNAPDLTAPIRQDIATFVDKHIRSWSIADRLKYQKLSAAIGNPLDVEKRRDIFVLWKAIYAAQGTTGPLADAAMTMATPLLGAAFSDVMLKAAIVASAAGARYVYSALTNNPVQFLQMHTIFIEGSTVGRERFSTAPNGNYQNVLHWYLHYHCDNDCFYFAPREIDVWGANAPVPAVSVPAVHWQLVPGVGPEPGNFAGILGCEVAGGPTLMLTTQFTGCSWCWTNAGGVLRAAHISPGGPGTTVYTGGGMALARQIINTGWMTNAPTKPLGGALSVFGSGDGNAVVTGAPHYPDRGGGTARYTSIFGLRDSTAGWRFYTQSIDVAKKIIQNESRPIL
jgi:hypothetical protein